MKKYRKKPVMIEAVQWQEKNLKEIMNWCKDASYEQMTGGQYMLVIETLESDDRVNTKHACSVNDYIIKGIQGEFYPCKPDIFKKTYEEIEELM